MRLIFHSAQKLRSTFTMENRSAYTASNVPHTNSIIIWARYQTLAIVWYHQKANTFAVHRRKEMRMAEKREQNTIPMSFEIFLRCLRWFTLKRDNFLLKINELNVQLDTVDVQAAYVRTYLEWNTSRVYWSTLTANEHDSIEPIHCDWRERLVKYNCPQQLTVS